MFTISTSTQNAQAAEMLKAITDVYKKFAAEGLTESEFVKAKQFVVGNMAFQLEGIGNATEKLLWLRFYGRDNSYIEKYGQHMADLSLETTNAAIREHFSPERLTVCTVGNQKVVKPLLEQFGAVECLHYRAKVQ
jgi:predicted Zn-dependent peptidase